MNLDELLAQYQPYDETEAAMIAQLQQFLAGLAAEAAFGRDLVGEEPLRGHITGSAWITNGDASQVVMLHHAKLGRWLQPGGHCDGQSDVLAVAMRETEEETGLPVSVLRHNVFDIDVHRIPEYWNTPEHWHYDVRFLLQSDDTITPQASHESRAVRWVSLDEAVALNQTPSIARLVAKTRQIGRVEAPPCLACDVD